MRQNTFHIHWEGQPQPGVVPWTPGSSEKVLVRFEHMLIHCFILARKTAYGNNRLLVTPIEGVGRQWVDAGRVEQRKEKQ